MAAFNELRRLIEPVMTVMETDESDEYLKPVWAPQILKFFNILNQIHSMYQLIQYTLHPIWRGPGVDNIRKIWLPSWARNTRWRGHFLRKNIYLKCILKKFNYSNVVNFYYFKLKT